GTLIHCCWECKMVHPIWKTVWCFLRKLNMLLPYNPATVLLGIYPKELKAYVHTKTCTWMFVAALFIIAKAWKQPRHPAVGKWINKLWYIQRMKYYSVLKRNELPVREKTWKRLKCILLRRGSQSEKFTYHVIPTIAHS
ncbi:LORF2 protein, partial [Crocuta crocuta]